MIQIITDSTSDLSQAEAKEYNISVLPLSVRFGTEEFEDGVTISMEEFYHRMESVEQLPKTSQVTPDAFKHAFEHAIKEGDDVLCITVSSGISGTHQSAVLARNMVSKPEKVFIVDTRNASLGEALLVFQAIRMRDLGSDVKTIAEKLESLKDHVRLIGKTDNLKYLVMGGRLSSVAGTIGTTLHLVPMLKFTDGGIHQAGLCHGKSKVIKWFIDHISESSVDTDHPMIFSGADCEDQVITIKDAVCDAVAGFPEEIMIRKVGAGIGTHTGPGLVAAAWIEQ